MMRCAAMLCLACLIMAAGGCQTTSVKYSEGSRPMPPEPRAAPVVPAGLQANEMAFLVGQKPEDSNGNGYPDLVRATVILFSSPHPTAIVREGEFYFQLYPKGESAAPDARPVAQWHYDNEAATQVITPAQYGPCYQFRLSLLETKRATDRMPLTRADLICRFEPADGGRIVTNSGVRSIQLGRRQANALSK